MTFKKATVLDWRRVERFAGGGRHLGDPIVEFDLRTQYHHGSLAEDTVQVEVRSPCGEVRDINGHLASVLDALRGGPRSFVEIARKASVAGSGLQRKLEQVLAYLVRVGWVFELQSDAPGPFLYELTDAGVKARSSLREIRR